TAVEDRQGVAHAGAQSGWAAGPDRKICRRYSRPDARRGSLESSKRRIVDGRWIDTGKLGSVGPAGRALSHAAAAPRTRSRWRGHPRTDDPADPPAPRSAAARGPSQRAGIPLERFL